MELRLQPKEEVARVDRCRLAASAAVADVRRATGFPSKFRPITIFGIRPNFFLSFITSCICMHALIKLL